MPMHMVCVLDTRHHTCSHYFGLSDTIAVSYTHLPLEIKIRDVQMMRFKVRSLIGDISLVHKMDTEIIESLWKMGKIDQIISCLLYTSHRKGKIIVLEYGKSMIVSRKEKHFRIADTFYILYCLAS